MLITKCDNCKKEKECCLKLSATFGSVMDLEKDKDFCSDKCCVEYIQRRIKSSLENKIKRSKLQKYYKNKAYRVRW